MQVGFRLEPPVSFILQQSGRFRRNLENLFPLWEKFKPIMSEIEAEHWASEGGGAWPGGPDYHGMVQSGALRSSLVDPGAAVQSEGPTEMIWGSDVFYAPFHHAGMGHNPVRLLIDVKGDGRQRFEQATVAWVNEIAAETWGAI